MRYPNQKSIKVHKTLVKKGEKGRRYYEAYNDVIENAAKVIKDKVPFMLFLYLQTYSNDYEFALSPQDFSNRYGISIDAARKAVAKLEALGYIVEDDKNKLSFYDIPQEIIPSVDLAFTEEKKWCAQKDGTYAELTFTQVCKIYGELPEASIKKWWDKQLTTEQYNEMILGGGANA